MLNHHEEINLSFFRLNKTTSWIGRQSRRLLICTAIAMESDWMPFTIELEQLSKMSENIKKQRRSRKKLSVATAPFFRGNKYR